VVEGYSLLVATRSVFAGAHAAGLSFREYIARGMDPTSIAVMLEDAAAVMGLFIAGKSAFCALAQLVQVTSRILLPPSALSASLCRSGNL
jgi:hypothetical protein